VRKKRKQTNKQTNKKKHKTNYILANVPPQNGSIMSAS
jgi:hypothetical protein